MAHGTVKKTIYLLNIANYAPQITSQTYPLIKKYADKIHATVEIITDEKFPGWPNVYQKLAIYEMAKKNGSDWHIYIDSDALIHPECPDYTEFLPRDTVLHNGSDFANLRWTYDRFFRRHGKNFGSCNWFAVASDWNIDLWKPLDDLTLPEALANIHPTANETACGITPEHLIDDYTLSRNIAKYGLKTETVMDMLPRLGFAKQAGFFYHEYALSVEEKVQRIARTIREWKIPDTMRKVAGK